MHRQPEIASRVIVCVLNERELSLCVVALKLRYDVVCAVPLICLLCLVNFVEQNKLKKPQIIQLLMFNWFSLILLLLLWRIISASFIFLVFCC